MVAKESFFLPYNNINKHYHVIISLKLYRLLPYLHYISIYRRKPPFSPSLLFKSILPFFPMHIYMPFTLSKIAIVFFQSSHHGFTQILHWCSSLTGPHTSWRLSFPTPLVLLRFKFALLLATIAIILLPLSLLWYIHLLHLTFTFLSPSSPLHFHLQFGHFCL